MPRSSPSKPAESLFSAFSNRSRRSSKVPSDDGHGSSGTPVRSGSISKSNSESKSLDRHARMKLAMAEAQSQPMAAHPTEDDETGETINGGSSSPRAKMAADQARAHAAASVAAAGGQPPLTATTSEKPGEGSLTFDDLAGDVVLADGLPSTAGSTATARPSSVIGDVDGGHRSNGIATAASPHRAASVAVPPSARSHIEHNVHPSASTSALLPGHNTARGRKLSDASSQGGHSESLTNSRKAAKSGAGGGIAAALAASGAGMAGLGASSPNAQQEAHIRAAAAARKNHLQRLDSHGQKVDKDYVGQAQGGVYRDSNSGMVVEKDGVGGEVRYHPKDSQERLSIPLRDRSASGASSVSEASSAASGLGAAANFPQTQAASLLTPTLSHNANAPSAPTTAIDSSHAEHHADARRPSKAGDGDDKASVVGSGSWPYDLGSQITGFAVASSKRNAEFHSLFPNVADDDYLIEDYGCALVREVFIQGRLYVSENHVCFNANIFGWVTNIVVPFSEIVSIEKRMTALIIPNAIQVATLHVKHTFSSLLNRDTTYDLVANIWKLSHPDVPRSAKAGAIANVADSDDSDDDDETGSKRISKKDKLIKRFMGVSKDETGSTKDGGGKAAAASATTSKEKSSSAGGDGNAAKGTKKDKHPPTSCPCEKEKKHLNVTALDTTYPCIPEKLFNLLFIDKFMEEFFTDNQKLFDLQMNDWDKSKDPISRSFSYIKPLGGSIGPKQTKCHITDEQLDIDFDDHVIVLTTTKTPDVPSGGSFSVKTRTCLTWNGGNTTRMLVTCQTEWTGRSMLKSVIDKASIDGQKQYYKDLDVAMRSHIKEHIEDFKEPGDEDLDEEAVKKAVDGTAPAGEDGKTEGAKSEAAAGSSSSDAGILGQIMDVASTVGETLGDLLGGLGELSPSMLILGGVVVLLVLSNIWAFSSFGAGRGQSRDPRDPHRLVVNKRSGGGAGEPEVIAHAVKEVLRDYLEPLTLRLAHAHSPHLTFAGGADLPSGGVAKMESVQDIQAQLGSMKNVMEEMEKRLQGLRTGWEQLQRQLAEKEKDSDAASREANREAKFGGQGSGGIKAKQIKQGKK